MRTTCFVLFTATALAAQTALETSRIEGRVVDVRGFPLPAVPVHVADWFTPDTVLAKGMTDGEGRFVVGKLPLRTLWVVTAAAAGFASSSVPTRAGSGPVTIMLPESVRVRGVLRDREHKAVPGVTVLATLADASQLAGARDSAVTDNDGNFVLANVPLGTVWLTAAIPGQNLVALHRYVAQDSTIDIAFGPPSWKTKDVVLEVTGLPETGPPDGARFHVVPVGGVYVSFPPPWDRMPLDAKGHAELTGMPEWVCTVAPRIPGYVCRPSHVQVEFNQTRAHFTVFPTTSTPGVEWSGTLRDLDDKPVAGVVLMIHGLHSNQDATTTTDAVGQWRCRLPSPADDEVVVRSVTDGWGLDALPSKNSALRLPTFSSRLQTKVDLTQPLLLRATRCAVMTGRVLLPDGRPADGVEVQLEGLTHTARSNWQYLATTRCDADGSYRFAGVPRLVDSFRIRAQGTEGAAFGEEFDGVQTDHTLTHPDVKLVAAAIVEGIAKDATGKPLPGRRIILRRYAQAPSAVQLSESSVALTDRAGRFRFIGVTGGFGALYFPEDTQGNPAAAAAAGPFEMAPGSTQHFAITPTK